MNELQAAKAAVRNYYQVIDEANDENACIAAMEMCCAAEFIWRGFHPFNELNDPAEVAQQFWYPLKSALKPMQRRLDLFFAGKNEIDGLRVHGSRQWGI